MIVAEISGNHKHSLDRAMEMVEVAADSGAHAIKLQTYTPDTMTLPLDSHEYQITSPNSPWFGRTLFDLYTEAYTPWDWHKPLFNRAKELGIAAFSSAFDLSSVDFLESIDTPTYKIASFECNDLRLLRKIAATGKPVIMSCGMAHLSEIELAVQTLRSNGCRDLALLHCTSAYPADPSDANLKTIVNLRDKFKCEVGISDHTIGTVTAIGAIAMGATIIEKHFTLDRNDGSIDASFSLEPDELRSLNADSITCWASLGGVKYGPTAESEKENRQYRRSLFARENMEAGQVIKSDDLVSLRPALGIDSKFIDEIVGSRVKNRISSGEPIRKENIESQ